MYNVKYQSIENLQKLTTLFIDGYIQIISTFISDKGAVSNNVASWYLPRIVIECILQYA